MKSDVLVLYSNQNKKLIDELRIELDLLGISATTEVVTFASLSRQLADLLHEHAMIVLLITEKFARGLERANETLTTISEAVAALSFELNKADQRLVERRLPSVKHSSTKSTEGLARAILVELAEPSRSQRLTVQSTADSIWRSPLYIFKAKQGLDASDDVEILVDVTWSSKPTRPKMAPALQKTLRATFDHLGGSKLKILDFGAGKLRHTLPLLEKGHTVDAVDFRSLYLKPTPEIKKNLQRAQQFGGRFTQVVYPSDFAKQKKHYDLILLINVLNVMPEPLERYFVLHKCNENLSKGGHLLWFCQHGDELQLKATSGLQITDGGCTSRKGRKTFYKDYNSRELIVRMMNTMGFEHVPLNVEVGKNHALLFQRTGPPAIDVSRVIQTSRRVIGRRVFRGEIESEYAVADVLDGTSFVGHGACLAVALKQIAGGRAKAHRYEDLVEPILEYIFQEDFKRATIEKQYTIYQGRQRIDIKADWRDASELRIAVVQNMGLKSSFVPIECKNYNKPLGNEEYAQLVVRCHHDHRHFGILLCRNVGDRKRVTRQCHEVFTAHNYLIIVFDDEDLIESLHLADDAGFEGIRNKVLARIAEVRDLRL
jgi:hypothetical protein